MVQLTPRESAIAEYLRSGDSLEDVQNLLGKVDMAHLTKLTPGKDMLEDMQRKQCLEKLLAHVEIAPRFASAFVRLFDQVKAYVDSSSVGDAEMDETVKESMEGSMLPVLELLSKLPPKSQTILIQDIFGSESYGEWFWLLKGSLKVADLTTSLIASEGVRSVLNLNVFGQGLLEDATIQKDEIIKFRFLQLVIELAKGSDNSATQQDSDEMSDAPGKAPTTRNGANCPPLIVPNGFEMISQSYFTDDILVKMSAVELFSQLGHSEKGRKFLTKHGLPEKIAEELMDEQSTCLDPRVAPTCLLFLSYIVRIDPDQYLEKFFPTVIAPRVNGMIDEITQTNDITQHLILLQIFGQLGSLPEWTFLEQKCPKLFELGRASLTSTNDEITKCSLAAWIAITSVSPSRGSFVGAQVMQIFEMKQHLRAFVWQLMTNMTKEDNLTRFLIESSVLRTMLLDYSSETSHDARVEKHKFLRALAISPVAKASLDDQAFTFVELCAKKGPYAQDMAPAQVVYDLET